MIQEMRPEKRIKLLNSRRGGKRPFHVEGNIMCKDPLEGRMHLGNSKNVSVAEAQGEMGQCGCVDTAG